jgi:predicted GNAT family acetyltransferase
MDEQIEVNHNAAEHRYELTVDGVLASIAEYTPAGGRFVFDHTETMPAFRGRGLAEQLVRAALSDVRSKNTQIVPSCWFVAEFIESHPEFADLVGA